MRGRGSPRTCRARCSTSRSPPRRTEAVWVSGSSERSSRGCMVGRSPIPPISPSEPGSGWICPASPHRRRMRQRKAAVRCDDASHQGGSENGRATRDRAWTPIIGAVTGSDGVSENGPSVEPCGHARHSRPDHAQSPGQLCRKELSLGDLYTNDEQKRIAEDTIADVDASGLWPGKVVTEVAPAGEFWQAEPEHQHYLEQYPGGYTCHFVRPDWKLPVRQSAVSLPSGTAPAPGRAESGE
jgi:Peptide methionine sulfoxide reductase